MQSLSFIIHECRLSLLPNGGQAAGYCGTGGSGYSNRGPGGGGGGASRYEGSGGSSGGRGDNGGPIMLLFVRDLKVTGLIESNGEQGLSGSARDGRGGNGAGGFVHIKALTADIGKNLIQANGVGPTNGTYGGGGGGSSMGRICIEACSVIGSTNQGSVSIVTRGQTWCGAGNIMM